MVPPTPGNRFGGTSRCVTWLGCHHVRVLGHPPPKLSCHHVGVLGHPQAGLSPCWGVGTPPSSLAVTVSGCRVTPMLGCHLFGVFGHPPSPVVTVLGHPWAGLSPCLGAGSPPEFGCHPSGCWVPLRLGCHLFRVLGHPRAGLSPIRLSSHPWVGLSPFQGVGSPPPRLGYHHVGVLGHPQAGLSPIRLLRHPTGFGCHGGSPFRAQLSPIRLSGHPWAGLSPFQAVGSPPSWAVTPQAAEPAHVTGPGCGDSPLRWWCHTRAQTCPQLSHCPTVPNSRSNTPSPQ